MARNKSQAVKPLEAPETQPVIENSGLCGTCENAVLCMYLGDAEHPVLECEEFTHHRAGASRPAARRLNIAVVPKQVAEEESVPLAMGLCFDCENRASCMFDRPESGVWQCEEYR
ncbi:MAG TPA: hypothetical protein VMT19_07970 [Thermoanaerobaculaceae bacterium]|nr:hypothetical protein [Thermoanaerobaculaceae bacterium]